jgi:hypothetical protein
MSTADPTLIEAAAGGDDDDDEEGVATEGYASTSDNKWAKNGYGQGVNKTSGKFSKDESEIVRKAVEEFCNIKQISVARLCSECDHKAELKGAWMEISKKLPHRSVQSVYRHGLRQLHPFKRGAWTEEECESLVDLVQSMGKKWAAIQQKLNRSADSCRDKHREMSDDYVRGRWKENETEMLKRLIREHLQADPTADIKELGEMVEAEGIKIPWSIMSRRMGLRSRLSCFKKWQKMTGLFSPSDQYKPPPKDGITEEGEGTEDVPNVVANTTSKKRKNESSIPRAAAVAKPLPPTHSARTAGAAAALAATAVNNPIVPASSSSAADLDLILLSELVSLGVTRSSDVNWEGMRLDWEGMRLENAHDRWNELLEEWQSTCLDDSALCLPLSEVAQLILERKTSAQRAAETVEAVDLPALNATREI